MREYKSSLNKRIVEWSEDSHDVFDKEVFTVFYVDKLTEVIQVIDQGYRPRNHSRKRETIDIKTLDKYPE